MVSEFEKEARVAKALFAKAKRKIPSASEIAEKAIESALSGKLSDSDYLKSNFSELVSKVQVDAYNIYLTYEKQACGEVLGELIEDELQKTDIEMISTAVADRFFALDRFFLSLTQSRRTRAGKAFEAVVSALFDALGYPHTFQPIIGESQPDYVLPSIEHYKNYATDCLIFTCKRTLRERWRQIVTEGMAGQAFFLATIDEKISVNELSRMKSRNVIVVVPNFLANDKYRGILNVISFEKFFDQHLDPAISRWKKNNIIP